MEYTTRTLPAEKNLALIAHDNMKSVLVEWARRHRETLASHWLHATGTTGRLLQQALDLPVNCLLSGPLGGDQQIGGMIASGQLDALVFLWDPFEPLPHDPDIKALLRVAAVWNIPTACNLATAEWLLRSAQFSQPLEIRVPDLQRYAELRGDLPRPSEPDPA